MQWKHSLCWIRRDIRLEDHAALSYATQHSDQITVAFVFDVNILDNLKDKDDRRLTFIYESLREIDQKLRATGSRLVICHGDPSVEIPALAKLLNVQAVITNHDYEPNAKSRDQSTQKCLQENNIDFTTLKDQVIFEKREILNQSGQPFKVFTPYMRAWLSKLGDADIAEREVNTKRFTPSSELTQTDELETLDSIGFKQATLWLKPGSHAALKRVERFLDAIDSYDQNRDYPARSEGTSGLSVHLRFGTISIRHLIRKARKRRSEGAKTWLSELIWREFYQMILDQYPSVCNESFKPEYRNIKWPGERSHFELWCKGKTGYPIVDAAMRHFAKTGWMHNRLRMIVASFLCKDLLLDWKLGEAWFARHLLDFDLAANNGGWQWSASTGCDAVPYFRIFNPITQSKRFDSKGEFIRSELPELAKFSDKLIHFPDSASPIEQQEAGCIIGSDYPKPVIDHGLQRKIALKLYQSSKSA